MSIALCVQCDDKIDTDEDEYYPSGVDAICMPCAERIYGDKQDG
jgi:hypothetical protein